MSQNSQSQPLLSPEDAADKSANLTSPSTLHGGHAMTQRSTRSQSQSVLFTEDDDDVAGNTPPPPPLPGEIATKRRLTRSTTRAGRGVPTPRQLDTPATPITPSRTVPPLQRTGLQPTASAMASPNPYTPLGEDEILDPRAEADEAAPPPDNPHSRVLTHGWDSFVNSLGANEQRELGVIDEILISYANFAGDAFNTFDIDSAHVMGRIIALEQSMGSDHDEIAQTSEALSTLGTRQNRAGDHK
jgi:hypothetical protein